MSFKRIATLACLAIASAIASAAHAEDLEARAERLKRMPAAEKEELQRKERRFLALSVTEQERLRTLYQAIEEAPDSQELQHVMNRYHAWLKTLRPGQRAEVLSLPPQERLEKIREIIQEQAARRFQHFAATKLDREDYKVLTDWMTTFVAKHEAEILPLVPPEKREWFESLSPPERQMHLKGFWHWAKPEDTPLPQEELDDLIARLSPEAQDELKRQTDQKQKIVLIKSWIRTAFYSAMMPGFQNRPPVSEEELLRFMREELPKNEREYLENMPVERMRRELRAKYHYWKNRRDWGGQRVNGPPRGGAPNRP